VIIESGQMFQSNGINTVDKIKMISELKSLGPSIILDEIDKIEKT
jgi:hypothetical protein